MAGKYRILLADDDTTGHPEWLEILGSWGYEAAAAADGEEALELITTFQPHLLLCARTAWKSSRRSSGKICTW
jgi:CheY-like chemotaxis protein